MYEGYFLRFLQSNKDFLLEEEIIAGISRRHCKLNFADYLEGPITTISRRHFRIFGEHSLIFIEDLGSTNGTKVNDERLLPHKPIGLFNRDLIKIADYDGFRMELVYGGTIKINPPNENEEPPPPPPRYGLYFKEDEQRFYVDGKAINGLKPRATELLRYLYKYKKEKCTYYEILRNVFTLSTSKHSVRVAVKDIRAQFEEVSPGSKRRYLTTVQGTGYKLVTE